MYTALALANLFGHLLGAKGKIFIFEMDQVRTLSVDVFKQSTYCF